MSQRITIEIKDKIATCLSELPVVCGNSDYVVDFVFDEEWDIHDVKTAIFVVNGKSIPQVFAGTACPVPVIQNTLIAWVGVFAGTIDDGTLSTTTPALVKCIPCITDGDNVPPPPADDVYNQIIGLIEAGMLKGEQGDKGDKGDKGDAGSISFKPVAELPTENIDNSVIYLVPIEGDGENTFAEYVYIDGKWELLGSVALNVDHSEYVKFTDYATVSKAGVIKTKDEFGTNMAGDTLYLVPAYDGEITNQSAVSYRPLMPRHISKITKVGMTDNKETWTDGEKAAACETIGAIPTPKANGEFSLVQLDRTAKNPTLVRGSHVPAAYAVAKFDPNANLKTSTPTEDNDAVNKKYAEDNFVAKPATPNRLCVLSIDDKGDISTIGTSLNAANNGMVPLYNPSGNINVNPPTHEHHAASKKYVDENKGTKLYLHTIKWNNNSYTFMSNSSTPLSTFDDFYNYYSKERNTAINERLGGMFVVYIVTGGPASLGGSSTFVTIRNDGAVVSESYEKSAYQGDTVMEL